ncbi:MAG TPA: CoA-binding protein [Candidatus Dormibacteraeota bacterium]|nr:CoA-binding protein [Candidatus Dormibacteraeota bacterium]
MSRKDLERVRDLVDLAEGRAPVPVLDDAAIAAVLRDARRIAVVGASPRPGRASNDVMGYLLDAGYDCVPVNPTVDEVLGRPAFPTVTAAAEAAGPFDIVDVFRRPEECAGPAREAVATGAWCVWLQLGIVSWEAARIAHDAGLGIVMDRCSMVEHRRLVAGR